MLTQFFTILTVEITKFLSENKNFFELSEKDKTNSLKDIKLPSDLKTYLCQTGFDTFANDLLELIAQLKATKPAFPKNELVTACAKFLAENFANDLYSLPLDYFKLNYDEQIKIVNNLISSDSKLANCLKDILTNNSYQEIIGELQNLLSTCLNSPIVIVQAPCEIDYDTKKEIIAKLNADNQAVCLPFFQVNKKIIGGLRIFVNGKVSDFSWLGKINLITSLK